VDSVLIANRGEIAVRIIRAARELGLRSIAVYSELDRDSVHVQMADEAWNIGPAPAAESYLNVERIIEVALQAKASAVHPGYGFLAENGGFADAVVESGLIWVGPPAAAIAMMGDKIASRRAAADAGVASVPGTLDPITDAAEVEAFASEHGYPIAIKASHGGGGKGLKVVYAADGVVAAFESAQREAEAWFAHPAVYVERYLEKPRHIEAQVLFDHHGNGVFLGERDCSVQRRHQKLIEETPAVGFSDAQRKSLGEAAIAVGAAAGYQNAGTVEFLLDQSGDFYFLEMNTRIQVEHTITEMVTGIDLVQEQLQVAAGKKLSFDASPPTRGHAIEFRINAEDAGRNFMPTPGTIVDYREPGGLGVRVDSGAVAGSAISQYYDNLVAKLVVWGRDRDEALRRSRRALDEYTITGIQTTIPAHRLMIVHPQFVAGEHHTKWVEDELDLSAIAPTSAPKLPESEELEERDMTVEVGGKRFEVRFWAPVMAPAQAGQRQAPRRRPPKLEREVQTSEVEGVLTAPMQGTIVKVHHKAGATVKAGESVCVLEAMKMENDIKSQVAGEIVELMVQPGDTVSAGAVLMVIR
jgi:acetyl-CoA/propionyl-CoA carboxylase biotin carboxyl carrier protein